MKRLALACCLILILSGCALTSTYTVDSSGNVSGTTTFSVPKSSVRNVTTLEQWTQVLQDNDLPSPTPTPSDSAGSTPSPTVSCGPGEDLVTSEWTYSCAVAGDITALSAATNLSDLTGQSGSSRLAISRVGTTVTITQPAATSDAGGFGLKGISLIYMNSVLTFPGTVTSVTGGAVKVDDHTVSFASDESQSQDMSATIEIPDLVGTPTTLSLTAKATASFPSGASVELTASLGTPADGQVECFDGDTSLSKETIGADGTLTCLAPDQQNGVHEYRAVFTPTNWWALDASEASKSLTVSAFTKNDSPVVLKNGAPVLWGNAKVGTQLSVGRLKISPAASSISYQWLRNSKAISRATHARYKVLATDYGKTISVRVTFRKAGYLPLVLFSPSQVKITQR